MTEKVVFIGDIHLRDDDRNDDRKHALDCIAEDEGRAVYVLLGDLNHGLMSIEDRNWLRGYLRKLVAFGPTRRMVHGTLVDGPGRRVIIVRGNHDRPGELYCFEDITGVEVRTRDSVIHAGGSVFLCVPYPDRGGAMAAGVSGNELFAQVIRRHLQDIEVNAWITVGHFNVAGAVASTGQPQIGREIELDTGLIDELATHGPVVLGHIHKPQDIGTSGQAFYAGSVTPQDWGELEEKRYLVQDENGELHSKPTAHRRRVAIDVTWPDLSDWDFTADHLHPRDEVRLRVHHPPGDLPDMDRIAALLHGMDTVKIECIPESVQGVRAPEIAAAESVVDQIAAYYADLNSIEVADVPKTLLEKVEEITNEAA